MTGSELASIGGRDPISVATPELAPGRRVLAALARIEAGRVARHPAVLLGVVAAVASLPSLDAVAAVNQDELAPLGLLAFLVGFLNVDRGRRDDTAELYEALPTPPVLRSGAVLLSMAVAGAFAAVLALGAWLAVVGLDGEVVREGFPVRPNPLEVVQGPFLITAFATVGVGLGRWTQAPVAAPLLMIVLLMGPIGWNIPWVTYGTLELSRGQEWLIADPAWHLLFLAGIAVTAAALTLLRDDRGRLPWLLLAAGGPALVLGAALQ